MKRCSTNGWATTWSSPVVTQWLWFKCIYWWCALHIFHGYHRSLIQINSFCLVFFSISFSSFFFFFLNWLKRMERRTLWCLSQKRFMSFRWFIFISVIAWRLNYVTMYVCDSILFVPLFRSCFRAFVFLPLVLLFFSSTSVGCCIWGRIVWGISSKNLFYEYRHFFRPVKREMEPVIFSSYASYVALHHTNSPSSLIPNSFSHT